MTRISSSAFVLLLALATASSQSVAQDGISIATVGVAKDASSEKATTVVAEIARQGFARNPKYSPVKLEQLLDSRLDKAQEVILNARGKLSDCKSAYDAFELQPSVEACTESVVLFEQGAAGLVQTDRLVDALLYQGAAFVLLGKSKSAKRAFERAQALSPGVLLPPEFPETVKELFAKAEASLEKKKSGSVTVYSTPSSAAVWVDGVFRGATPVTVQELPVGKHIVRLQSDGYLNAGAVVDVKKRRDATVQESLVPAEKEAAFKGELQRIREKRGNAHGGLAQFLKVDQLLVLEVNASGADVSVSGTLVDGVKGTTITQANKTFVADNARYKNDLQLWVAQKFRKLANEVDPNQGGQANSGVGIGNQNGGEFNEAPVVEKKASNKTVTGWTVIGVSAVPLAVGIGSGIYSLYTWDLYKNQGVIFNSTPITDQLNPQLQQVRSAFFVSSIIADIGYGLALVGGIVGTTLVVLGKTEEKNIEDVLSNASPAPPPLRFSWGQP